MFADKSFFYGVSRIGLLHVKHNIPNQDSYLCYSKGNLRVIVLSDGLGSKKHSDIGSQAACLAVKDIALKTFKWYKNQKEMRWESFLENIYQQWISIIIKKKLNIKDCYSTCLFSIIYKNMIYTASLGDGMIFLMAKSERDSILIIDEKEDNFSNVTNCLRSEFYFKDWKTSLYNKNKYKNILITTDGISSDLEENNVREFCLDFIKELNSKSKKKGIKFCEDLLKNWPVKLHSDDQTLAFMRL